MLPKTETEGQTQYRPKTAAAKAPRPPKPEAAPVSRISAARAAVRHFLTTELEAREIRITKIAPLDQGGAGWSAEAEILVPNLGVKMLGLPLTQEILERDLYAVELDADLSVRSYAHLGQESE